MIYYVLLMLYYSVSLNGDEKPKQKTSESGESDDNSTKEGVSKGGLTTKEADGSLSDITGKDCDSDDQQSEGEEHTKLKHSRSTELDDPDYDDAGSKRFCPTPL